MKKILCCSCFKMDKKASIAYSTLFPTEVLPPIIKGRDRIYKFAKEIDNPHLLAISKLSGKFAYYVNIEGNNITEEYDLMKMERIA